MKWISIFACAICFSVFFFLGFRGNVSVPIESAPPVSVTVEPSLLSGGNAAKVFLATKSGSMRKVFSDPLQTSALEERFVLPYPPENEHLGAGTAEQIARIGLLKALARDVIPDQSIKAIRFYRAILDNKNEQWMVKRQALRNLLALSSYLTEKERSALIAGMPKALLIQAGQSEQEILEEFSRHAAR